MKLGIVFGGVAFGGVVVGTLARLRVHARNILFWSLAIAAVTSVAFAAHDFAKHSPYFAIRRIALSGNARISTEALTSLADLEPGQNIFRQNEAEIAARLERNTWLDHVTVQRVLPNRINIAVTEHRAQLVVILDQPIAWSSHGARAQTFLLNQAGQIFGMWSPEDNLDLPTLTGLTSARVEADIVYRREVVTAALWLLEQSPRILHALGAVQEIHIGVGETFEVYYGARATRVVLGTLTVLKDHHRASQRLEQTERIVSMLRARNRFASVIRFGTEDSERAVIRLEN